MFGEGLPLSWSRCAVSGHPFSYVRFQDPGRKKLFGMMPIDISTAMRRVGDGVRDDG